MTKKDTGALFEFGAGNRTGPDGARAEATDDRIAAPWHSLSEGGSGSPNCLPKFDSLQAHH